MSSNSTHEFPSPAGGIPYPIDYAPSIVFAVLYGLMVPVVIWRMVHPNSRNAVLIGTAFFSIERVVGFALRAIAAHNSGLRNTSGFETYLQATYSGGFISMGQDLMNLFRSLLVGSTLGGDMIALHKLTPPQASKARSDSHPEGDPEEPERPAQYTFREAGSGNVESRPGDGAGLDDQPRARYWVRQVCGILSLVMLAATVMNIVASIDYQNAVKSGADAALVRALWRAGDSLAIALLMGMAHTAVWVYFYWPRVPRNSALLVVVISTLLTVVGIYRLAIVGHSTTSLASTAPGSQNSGPDKALFYVFHVAPEFLSAAILMSLNVRRVFATGMWGDLRGTDPKPKSEAQ